MKGWVMLHREIFNHWIWKNPKYFKAWIYCILRANHEGKSFLHGTELHNLVRGEFITSLQNFSNDTDLTIQNTRTFLKLLEKDSMIERKSTQKLTKVTICNYDKWNNHQHIDNTQVTNKQHTGNKQLTTDNNVNNVNNVNNDNNKNIDYRKQKLSSIDFYINNEHLQITKSFQELFRANLEEAGASTKKVDNALGTWIDPIRLLIESDGYTVDQIRSVFQFLRNDDFWKKNILSTKKLRIQFDKLIMNVNGKTRQNNKEATSPDDLIRIYKKHGLVNEQ
jgi:hypothetical protein